jgi:hypothetical protein
MDDKNSKPKSIIVDGDLHYKLKMKCKSRNLKIGALIEDLIRLYLTDPREVEKVIENIRNSKKEKSIV